MDSSVLARLSAALAGRYTLERELGRGGMATVWLARDLRHDRPVALKVLRPELAAALGPERFLREITLTAGLDHPHILPLLDSGGAAGFLYYTMPFVEGESLRDRLTREQQLPLEDAIQITREVADALGYAHSRGVVHRDIKPENILLAGGHARVADFGIATALTAAGGDRLTETGIAVGTPAYMSPEQGAGSRELDGRSDLYSLGCVLYEMLAGHPPFTGATAQEVLARHSMDGVPLLTAARPAVPAGVVAALNSVLAKVPADRCRTAALFAAALGQSPSVVSNQSLLPTGRAHRQATQPWLLVLGGGAVLIGAAAIIMWLWNAPRSSQPRDEAPRLLVLPFTNRGAAEDDEFVGGMTEVVTAELASLNGLDVLSSRAAREYERTAKAVRQIAAELNAAYVLDASVQRERPGESDSPVRIVVQLTNARDNTTLWAATLLRDSTNLFRVQAQIAQEVAEKLDLALSHENRLVMGRTYTEDSRAWDDFLRAVASARPGNSTGLAVALELLDRAASRDSSFALAYAWRSWVNSQIDWFRFDTTTHQAAALWDAERALQLDPNLAEAHWALGCYHYVYGPDYERALRHLTEARRRKPSDANTLWILGNVYKRTGRWSEAITTLSHAATLDPTQAWLPWNIAQIHLWKRDYDAAERTLDRTLAIDPNMPAESGLRAWLRLMRDGDIVAARRVIDEVAARTPDSRRMLLPALLDRFDPEPEAEPRSVTPAQQSGKISWDVGWMTGYTLLGLMYQSGGRPDLARTYLDSALAFIEPALAVSSERRQLAAARSELALVLAALGRTAEAERESASTLSLDPIALDAINGPFALRNVAAAYATLGHLDRALDIVEQLLAKPALFSTHILRLDPAWDPLRNHPRFQTLLRRYSEAARN